MSLIFVRNKLLVKNYLYHIKKHVLLTLHLCLAQQNYATEICQFGKHINMLSAAYNKITEIN